MSKRNENRPGYKNSKVGWIPEEWECVWLRKLGDKKRPAIKAGPFGSSLKKECYVENGYKIYGQEQVISGNPFYGDYFIDEKRFSALRSCEVFPGDILLSLVGTIGKALLIPPDYKKGIINPRLLRISLNKECVSSLYIKNFLEAEHTLRLLNSWAQGGTMGVLNAQIVGSLPIPLPPLPEQKKIAEILSAWDRGIEITNRLITNYELLKKGLMQQLLSGRMRFPEFGKPARRKGELPEGWRTVRLGKLADVSMGTSPSSDAYNNLGVGLPLIQGNADIVNRTTNPTRWTSQVTTVCDPNDLIMSVRAPVGEIAKSQHKACVGRGACVMTIKDSHSKEFLFQILLGAGTTWHRLGQGSTFACITGKEIRSAQFVVPCQREQTRIAAVLSTCDREIELLKKKKEKLKEQKKALMQKLLTGEIRHPEFLKEGHL